MTESKPKIEITDEWIVKLNTAIQETGVTLFNTIRKDCEPMFLEGMTDSDKGRIRFLYAGRVLNMLFGEHYGFTLKAAEEHLNKHVDNNLSKKA